MLSFRKVQKTVPKSLKVKLETTVNMGWHNHFLKRTGMNCIVRNGDIASADVESAVKGDVN